MPTRDEIHSTLEAAIKQSGLSYAQVAALASITTRHLYRARIGEAPDAAIRVLRALGYTVHETVEVK